MEWEKSDFFHTLKSSDSQKNCNLIHLLLISNLTNKYNPQELIPFRLCFEFRSNLTNKYNPQEQANKMLELLQRSNLTNKYNPQELFI